MAKRIEGSEQINKILQRTEQGLIKSVAGIITLRSRGLQSYIKTEHLTGGTTETRLRTRSGRLRGSVIPLKTEIKETSVEGGVSFGTEYARAHVGPQGQTTVIRPKRGKYLTIPLEAAMTPSGVAKGSAMFGPWTNTFVRESKAGNLIMFGQMTSYQSVKVGGVKVKGLSIRKIRSQIVPLFLLKKQVTIRARVHPADILNWIAPKIAQDLRGAGLRVNG